MTEAQFEVDTKALKKFLEIPNIIVDEVVLKITEDGIRTRTVDDAHVAMIDIELNDLNNLELEDEMEIAVNIKRILDFLKLVDDDTVNVTINGAIFMETEKYNNPGRKMPTLDTAGHNEPNIPTLDLPNKAVIDGSQFKQAVKSAETIAEHIILKLDPDALQASAEKHENKINLNLTSSLLSEIEADESVRCIMALDRLTALQRKIAKSDELKIKMGNDYPIKITWNYAEENECRYLQAPRIENN